MGCSGRSFGDENGHSGPSGLKAEPGGFNLGVFLGIGGLVRQRGGHPGEGSGWHPPPRLRAPSVGDEAATGSSVRARPHPRGDGGGWQSGGTWWGLYSVTGGENDPGTWETGPSSDARHRRPSSGASPVRWRGVPGRRGSRARGGGEVRRGLPGPSAPLSKVEEEASEEGGPEAEASNHPGCGIAAVVHRSGPWTERTQRQGQH